MENYPSTNRDRPPRAPLGEPSATGPEDVIKKARPCTSTDGVRVVPGRRQRPRGGTAAACKKAVVSATRKVAIAGVLGARW